MDVLWRRQGDMFTILKTLPADSWTVTDNVFVRESRAPWAHRGPYLFLSPCRGTSRRMSGNGSKHILHAWSSLGYPSWIV